MTRNRNLRTAIGLRDSRTLRFGNEQALVSVWVSQGDDSSKSPKFGLAWFGQAALTLLGLVGTWTEKPGYEGALAWAM